MAEDDGDRLATLGGVADAVVDVGDVHRRDDHGAEEGEPDIGRRVGRVGGTAVDLQRAEVVEEEGRGCDGVAEDVRLVRGAEVVVDPVQHQQDARLLARTQVPSYRPGKRGQEPEKAAGAVG